MGWSFSTQVQKLINGYSAWQEWTGIKHSDLMFEALMDLQARKVGTTGAAFKSWCKKLKIEGVVRDALIEAVAESHKGEQAKPPKLTWDEAVQLEKEFCSQKWILSVRNLEKKRES